MTRHVVVVGSANMDLVLNVRDYPAPGETIFGESFAMFPGGKGANQAVACAKLGGTVRFLGKVGKDLFGERLARSMRQNGVRLDRLLVDNDHATGTALITVDKSGQNEIVVISGANMQLLPRAVRRERDIFASASVLLVQLEIPLATVKATVDLAHAAGVIVVLNPAPARPLPNALLAKVDYLTPNVHELGQLTSSCVETTSGITDAARKLIARGVKHVIVTMGRQGCLVVASDSVRHFPARRARAVDTTAAGDAFNGALAMALARGDSLESAAHFANAVGAFTVTRRGAQASLPTIRDIQAFLRS
jgi:ribokinase